MFLLGVAHRHCTQRCVERLRSGAVNVALSDNTDVSVACQDELAAADTHAPARKRKIALVRSRVEHRFELTQFDGGARRPAYAPRVLVYGVVSDFLDEAVELFPTLATGR
jgi:hypothetical protein